MIPGWKVKRELIRLGQQLKAIPEFFWEPFAIRAHNAAFKKGFPTFEGQVPLLPKVAIVVCFQPKGLAKSFFITLSHLVENGYSPLVISNSQLSDQDKEYLKPNAWRVVERPNFGYDFGGYRDGIFLLRKWNIPLDRLVILNDSIWYPVWENDTTLQKAEESEFDVVGMVLHEQGDLRFLESYFFSIKGRVLESNIFMNFWKDMRLTSNRFKVVRTGERDFGRHLELNKISYGSIFNQNDFKLFLKKQSIDEIKEVLNYYTNKSEIDFHIQKNMTSIIDKETAIQIGEFIQHELSKISFVRNFQVIAAKKIGFAPLKKGGATLAAWRRAWLRAVDDQFLPPPFPEVLEEVKNKAKNEEYININ